MLFLGKIKTYALAGLAVVSAVLFGLLQSSRLGKEKNKRKQSEASLKSVKKAYEIDETVDHLSDDDVDKQLLKYQRKD